MDDNDDKEKDDDDDDNDKDDGKEEDKENKDQSKHLKVQYKGITPDMFQDEGEVVVEGIIKDGIFHAQTLLTSCPSKYEAEKQAGKTHPGNMKPYELKKPEMKPFVKTAI